MLDTCTLSVILNIDFLHWWHRYLKPFLHEEYNLFILNSLLHFGGDVNNNDGFDLATPKYSTFSTRWADVVCDVTDSYLNPLSMMRALPWQTTHCWPPTGSRLCWSLSWNGKWHFIIIQSVQYFIWTKLSSLPLANDALLVTNMAQALLPCVVLLYGECCSNKHLWRPSQTLSGQSQHIRSKTKWPTFCIDM